MAERRDESDLAACFGNAHIARRSTRRIVDVFEGPGPLQPGPHQRQRQIPVGAIVVYFAHRHRFDQRQIVSALAAPTDHVIVFIVVDTLQRHGVDLHPQAGVAGGRQAALHLSQFAAAGDFAKPVGPHRIH